MDFWACFVNPQRTTLNAQRIIHVAGFSQWLMTKKNERRIHSAMMRPIFAGTKCSGLNATER